MQRRFNINIAPSKKKCQKDIFLPKFICFLSKLYLNEKLNKIKAYPVYRYSYGRGEGKDALCATTLRNT